MSTKKRVNKPKRKQKKKNKFLKSLLLFLVFAIAIGSVAYGGYLYYTKQVNPPKKQISKTDVPTAKIVKLEINEADTINSFAKKVSLTFPKLKMTQQQIVEQLNSRQRLEELQKTYRFIPARLSDKAIQYPLEGLFVPLTYDYYEDDTLETIIKKPLDAMKKFYDTYKPQLAEKGIEFYDALILASITNAEVPTTDHENLKIVAQIFNNRLQAGIGLGSDATLVYALGKKNLTKEDFDKNTNSPYNTRINRKLTPTPIQFVTESAMKAIVQPTANDYYYFLTGTCQGREDYGKFYYAKTYEEHQKNIQDHMTC